MSLQSQASIAARSSIRAWAKSATVLPAGLGAWAQSCKYASGIPPELPAAHPASTAAKTTANIPLLPLTRIPVDCLPNRLRDDSLCRRWVGLGRLR